MKKNVLFLVLLITAVPILAGKVVPLPDVVKPENIVIDKDQFLITEFPHVFIYSSKDFKLIKKFGKKGEGPQEFSEYVTTQMHPDNPEYIVANTRMKVAFFTRKGEYVKEIRSKVGILGSIFKPLGKNYAAYGVGMEKDIVVRKVEIYNPKLEKIKEVTRWRRSIQLPTSLEPLDTDMEGGEFKIYDKKIFFLFRENGSIKVFDHNGKKLFSIDYKYERIPVTEDDKKRFNHFYAADRVSSAFYKRNKELFKYPSYFPAARSMRVVDNKIYILTNKRKGQESEFVILDTGGKFLKKSMVPFKNANPRVPYPFTISSGKLFQLVENDDTEEWELHIHPVL